MTRAFDLCDGGGGGRCAWKSANGSVWSACLTLALGRRVCMREVSHSFLEVGHTFAYRGVVFAQRRLVVDVCDIVTAMRNRAVVIRASALVNGYFSTFARIHMFTNTRYRSRSRSPTYACIARHILRRREKTRLLTRRRGHWRWRCSSLDISQRRCTIRACSCCCVSTSFARAGCR